MAVAERDPLGSCQLRDLIPFSDEELEVMGDLEAEYKPPIPPYYFSLIDCEEPNDPIRLQSVTSPLEANSEFEMEDPLERGQGLPRPRHHALAIPIAASW